MKKPILLFVICFAVLNTIKSQSATRTLANFSALKVNGALNVILIKGNENVVNITASNIEDLKNVKTTINNNQLVLSFNGESATTVVTKKRGKTKRITKTRGSDIKIKLIYTNINRITQSGASTITALDTINTNSFFIKSSGASDIVLGIISDKLTLNTSGASDVKLAGSVNTLTTNLSGASDVKAGKLIAKNVIVKVSGAADVTLFADSAISGTISGAADVHIKGNPSYRNLNSTGVSTINDYSYGLNDNFKVKVGKNNKLAVTGDNVNLKMGENEVKVVNDTTRIKFFGYKLLVIDDSVSLQKEDKKRRNHWAGIDLGINGFVNNSGSFNLNNDANLALTNPKEVTQFMELSYSKSWTVSVNFFEYFLKLKTHHFGLVTGVGMEWNNYELKHNVLLTAKGGNHVFTNVNTYNQNYTWGEVDSNLTYSENRFKTFYINLPLLLELNTGNHKNKSFHIDAGAIFGINLQSKMKYKYNLNGDNKKTKDKQSFNTNPFKMALTTRAGVGWFTIFATYNLTPLFENNRGPKLYPFSVGVTLLGF